MVSKLGSTCPLPHFTSCESIQNATLRSAREAVVALASGSFRSLPISSQICRSVVLRRLLFVGAGVFLGEVRVSYYYL